MQDTKPLHPDLATIISHQCEKNALGAWFGVIILGAMACLFMFIGFKIPFVPAILIGILPLIGLFFIYHRFRGDFKGYDFWMDIFQNTPEEIVWIKPVVTSHTMAFVVTLYKERSFDFYTRNGLRLRINIDSLKNHRLLFDAIRSNLPHAHIGYSELVDSLYGENKNMFIKTLKDNGLYTPIGSIKEPL